MERELRNEAEVGLHKNLIHDEDDTESIEAIQFHQEMGGFYSPNSKRIPGNGN